MHITHILRGVKLLRTLYLNFDASLTQINDPWDESPQWLDAQVRINRRGSELVAVLDAGERFERLALLVHTLRGGIWVVCRPAWAPGFRFDYSSNDRLYVSVFLVLSVRGPADGCVQGRCRPHTIISRPLSTFGYACSSALCPPCWI